MREVLQLARALALGTVFSLSQAWAADPFSSHDLYRDARLSQHKRLPVLLLFSADYCGFCTRLMEEFLIPMHRSGDYRDKVLMRELKIDSYETVRDFENRPTMPEDLAYRYNISVTPTILFLDHQGKELTRRMVGLGTADFFGLYLDAAIASARARLQARTSHHPSAANPPGRTSTALRLARVLNVVSATPPRSDQRAPCSHAPWRPLATMRDEKCGLAQPGS